MNAVKDFKMFFLGFAIFYGRLWISEAKLPKKPNILFILADDLGWNDVGYHGSEIKTPNLDELAAKGVKLENYYVQPCCTPTRGVLMSGRYPIHIGMPGGVIHPEAPDGLPLNIPTMADALNQAGYSTHMVGKWHLGFYKKEHVPVYRGFDSYYGYFNGAEDYFTHQRCDPAPDGVKKKSFCGLDLHENMDPDWNQSGVYSTHLFTKRVETIVANHDDKKPLFLYLAFQAVHSPLQVPPEYTKPYDDIKDKTRRIFAGMVNCLDEAVRNVTDTFKKHGLWDNTILVFSTETHAEKLEDNGAVISGGGNNYPLRGEKFSLWEGGIRAVGFVTSPLLQNTGINNELMHVSDWFPTFLHLADQSGTVSGLDGFNQWDTISKGLPSPRKELLHKIDQVDSLSGKLHSPDISHPSVAAAIRCGDYKLLTGNVGNGTWEPPPGYEGQAILRSISDGSEYENGKKFWLFNIRDDPNEQNDLSQSKPEKVKKLLKRLQHYSRTAVPFQMSEPDPRSDPSFHGDVWGPWED